MIGYGIPINEFSFGNTLIVAGTTACRRRPGRPRAWRRGCPIAADRRNAGARGPRTAQPAARGVRTAAPRAAPPAPSRIPFPPRPKPTEIREPRPSDRSCDAAAHEAALDEHPIAAPTLRNPDMPVAVERIRELRYRRGMPMSAIRRAVALAVCAQPDRCTPRNATNSRRRPARTAAASRRRYGSRRPPISCHVAAETPRRRCQALPPTRAEIRAKASRSRAKTEAKYEPIAPIRFASEFKPDSSRAGNAEPTPDRVEPEPGQPQPASEPPRSRS